MSDRVLVDTHLVLWAANAPGRLSQEARDLLEDRSVDLVFSAASIWEIAIKLALGRPDFRVDLPALVAGLRRGGWTELGVTSAHAERVRLLPALHGDPFDRMLVAQSLVEEVLLLTHDRSVAAYEAHVRLV